MMNMLFVTILLLLLVLLIGVVLYVRVPRKYQSADSVATSYDDWTNDGILEFYWGEHIHLGHYGLPPREKDFLQAKSDFVHEMVRWGGLDKLPSGTTVLDVGCGIGGSSRMLAREYGFAVTGITISPQQVRRAQELTSPEVNAHFQVDDALALSFPDASFDVVWSVEAGPHMPDKAQFARELMRVLKPGGTVAFSTWPPELLVGKMFALIGRYAPPPPAGASPPHQWGDPTIVRQRLGEAVTDLFFDRDVMYFQILSPQHQRLFLEANVGPVGKLVENLGRTDPVRLAAFRADLEQLMALYFDDNRIKQDFLLTRARKR